MPNDIQLLKTAIGVKHSGTFSPLYSPLLLLQIATPNAEEETLPDEELMEFPLYSPLFSPQIATANTEEEILPIGEWMESSQSTLSEDDFWIVTAAAVGVVILTIFLLLYLLTHLP